MGDFILPEEDLEKIINSLDETSGFLIKTSELKYWIEFFVNKERKKHQPDASCYSCSKFNVCVLALTIHENVGVFFNVDRAEQVQVYDAIALRCIHFKSNKKEETKDE